MKITTSKLLFVAVMALLLQGCVAFPPLIQVEHKDNPNAAPNREVLRRLDNIVRRLTELEQKTDRKP